MNSLWINYIQKKLFKVFKTLSFHKFNKSHIIKSAKNFKIILE